MKSNIVTQASLLIITGCLLVMTVNAQTSGVTLEVDNGEPQQIWFDLSVGTERHYHDCAGLNDRCLPAYGVNGLATEIVIGEIEIDGKIWAEVAWAYTKDYWPEDPDAFVVYDTAFYRTDGPLLFKHTAGGDSLIFDFGFAKGDSLLNHFLPFIPGDQDQERYLQDNYRYMDGDLPSVVLFDTTIAFPDGIYRRITWGDDTLRTQFGDYYPIIDASVFVDSLETFMNLPLPRYFIRPFYYIEGLGVMKTPVNHRHMNMSGFKASDGMEFGWMNEISVSVEVDPERPAVLTLHQNYPNPFNPSTVIRYTIFKRSAVELSVYDIIGRLIAVPVNIEQGEGEYTVSFDASNLAGGVYMYVLRANGGLSQSRKMILIK